MSESRPPGIAVIIAFQVIGAIGWILVGALAVLNGGLTDIFGQINRIMMVVGVALIIHGIIGIVITYGLWTGRAWARTICMVLAVISIGFTIPSIMTGIGLIRLLIDVLILFILTRHYVKAFYARSPRNS